MKQSNSTNIQLVNLKELYGLSCQDIAVMLDCSLESAVSYFRDVKSSSHRKIPKLKLNFIISEIQRQKLKPLILTGEKG